MTQPIESYIAQAPADRRSALTRIRHLCRSTLAGAEEIIDDGMVSYMLRGTPKAAFANQAHHIAFYVFEPSIVEVHAGKFTDPANCMIQFHKAADVDYELIGSLLHDTAEANR